VAAGVPPDGPGDPIPATAARHHRVALRRRPSSRPGPTVITARQRSVAGHDNQGIACERVLSQRTVRNHAPDSVATLRVAARADAIARARGAGPGLP